jgi:hypothetical protein
MASPMNSSTALPTGHYRTSTTPSALHRHGGQCRKNLEHWQNKKGSAPVRGLTLLHAQRSRSILSASLSDRPTVG